LSEPRAIEEFDIRLWFVKTDLEQALDTFRVVEGILQARQEAQPARKRRRDAGVKRATEPLLNSLDEPYRKE
jgi:hypothetical protein